MSKQEQRTGQRLAVARKRKGWTQEQLGRAMGFSAEDGQVRVSRWETGTSKLRYEDASLAARSMGIPVYSLLPEAEVENLLEWLEATARHQADLSPANARRLNEALETLAEWVGPVPTSGDDQDWNEYLDGLRRFLVQAHKGATEDISPRG